MTQKKQSKDRQINQRIEAFESLPPHIKEELTQEEKEIFLHSEQWPESLFKKLEEFIVSDH